MFPLWVVGKGEEGNPLQARAGKSHRSTGQRRTKARVTKAVKGRSWKGQRAAEYSMPGDRTKSEEKASVSGSKGTFLFSADLFSEDFQ